MLPVKVVIADDETAVSSLLRSILSELEGALVIGTAENAKNTINLVKEENPDFAFLDIELPDMQGIELAEKLRDLKQDIFIVFITAHKEYSSEAFELYAYDYILKPIDLERVKATFRRIQQVIQMSEKVDLISNLKKSRISINLGNERVFVKVSEIYYIEKIGRYTLIHCISGEFKIRETLQELERRLGMGFFRSHKSFIINIDQVDKITNFADSSYYEVKFKNYKGKALLSRDRVHALMAYSIHNF